MRCSTALIFAGGAGCIDGVWRAGRKLVSEGRHIERGEIGLAAYQATLRRTPSVKTDRAARKRLPTGLRHSSVDTGITVRILARAEGD